MLSSSPYFLICFFVRRAARLIADAKAELLKCKHPDPYCSKLMIMLLLLRNALHAFLRICYKQKSSPSQQNIRTHFSSLHARRLKVHAQCAASIRGPCTFAHTLLFWNGHILYSREQHVTPFAFSSTQAVYPDGIPEEVASSFVPIHPDGVPYNFRPTVSRVLINNPEKCME